MGFANRSQMERVRKEAIKVAPEQWRRALRETTAAEAAFQRGQMNEQQNTAAGRARGEYNTAVPRELRVVYSPPPIR